MRRAILPRHAAALPGHTIIHGFAGALITLAHRVDLLAPQSLALGREPLRWYCSLCADLSHPAGLCRCPDAARPAAFHGRADVIVTAASSNSPDRPIDLSHLDAAKCSPPQTTAECM